MTGKLTEDKNFAKVFNIKFPFLVFVLLCCSRKILFCLICFSNKLFQTSFLPNLKMLLPSQQQQLKKAYLNFSNKQNYFGFSFSSSPWSISNINIPLTVANYNFQWNSDFTNYLPRIVMYAMQFLRHTCKASLYLFIQMNSSQTRAKANDPLQKVTYCL